MIKNIKQNEIFYEALIILFLVSTPIFVLLSQAQSIQNQNLRQLNKELIGIQSLMSLDDRTALKSPEALDHWINTLQDISESSEIILDPVAETYFLGQIINSELPNLIFLLKNLQNSKLTSYQSNSNIDKFQLNKISEKIEQVSKNLKKVELNAAQSQFNDQVNLNIQQWNILSENMKQNLKLSEPILKNIDHNIKDLFDYRRFQISQLKLLLESRKKFYEQNQKRFNLVLLFVFLISVSLAVSLFLRLINKIKEDAKNIAEQSYALEKSLKLAALGELTSGLGHEIANPLTVIMTSLNQLAKKNESSTGASKEDIQKHFEKTNKAVNRVVAIINSIRSMIIDDHSKNFVHFNLKDTFEDVLSMLQHLFLKHQINLTLDDTSELPPVYGLQTETGQILTNLIKNAIEVLAQQEHRKIEIKFNFDSNHHRLKIYVLDSGPGIPDELKDKIFNHLFSTKTQNGGTGIGLSYSQKMAQKMNAELKLVDHQFLLHGACFELTIPTQPTS